MEKPKTPKQRFSKSQVFASFLRTTLRWSLRLLKSIAVLVATLLLSLAVIQLTPAGRDLVLHFAIRQVNGLIPGTLSAKRLDRLSLLGIDLKGLVVLDPKGAEVLTLDRLQMTTHLSRILRGEVALRLVHLDGLKADARKLEEGSGLLSAFVDSNAAPSPPSSGPPPDIFVDRVDLKNLRVQLPPVARLGQVDTTIKQFTGTFRLTGGLPSAHIDEAMVLVERQGKSLLTLRATGQLPEEEGPSKLKVHMESLGMSLDVAAQAFLPHQESWDEKPLSVDLALRGVSAAALSEILGDATLQEAFLGNVSLSLQTRGSLWNLNSVGTIQTAAGTIELSKIEVREKMWGLDLALANFELARLRSDLPPHTVSGQLSLEAQGTLPQPLELKLSLRGARVDSEALMDADLSAKLGENRVEDITLALTSDESKLQAEGQLGFDGSAKFGLQIDLRSPLLSRLAQLAKLQFKGRFRGYAQIQRSALGNLTLGGRLNLDQMQVEDWRAEALETRFALSGVPPDLSGTVDLDLKNAHNDELYLDELALELKGGLRDLTVALRGQGAQTPLPTDGTRDAGQMTKLDLSLQLQRRLASTQIDGRGVGKVLGRDFELKVEESEFFDGGAFSTKRTTLSLGGQEIVVQGSFGTTPTAKVPAPELLIEATSLDLTRLAQLAGRKEPLVGGADLNARVGGSIELPVVHLDLRGHSLGLRGKPLVDLQLVGELDVDAGKFELTSSLKGDNRLALSLSTKANFAGGRGGLSRLLDAEGNVELNLTDLSTVFLESYLPPGSIPFGATANANLRAEGSRLNPRLDTQIVIASTDKNKVEITHQLHYGDGAVQSTLAVDDAQGAWAKMSASAQLSPQTVSFEELLRVLPTAAEHASYRLELKTRKRDLTLLPLIDHFVDPKGLPPVSFFSDLMVTHQPQAEPELRFHLEAQQSSESTYGGCKSARGRVVVDASHLGTRNALSVHALINQRKALELGLTVEQALLPLFGGQKPSPGPLDLKLSSAKLDLSELPFVCDRASGTASLEAQGSDLMGTKPRLQIKGQIERLSLGGKDTLDLQLGAAATKDGMKAQADLHARGKFEGSGAQLEAEVPWKLSRGKLELQDDLPLRALLRLKHLPIGPILPPKGAISYARGSLDGEVQARGTMSAPQFTGEIFLEDLAFTSTAIAQPLRDIQGRLVFSGRKVTVSGFEAHDREGTLRIDGSVDLTNTKRVEGKIKIEADDFPLRQAGQVVAITNLKAEATSTVTNEGTEAYLHLTDVDTWLENAEIRTGISLDTHSDFTVDGERTEKAARPISSPKQNEISQEQQTVSPSPESGELPTETSEQRTHIVLDAHDRFWIKREDFAVKMGMLLDTEVQDEEVRIRGEVTIERGYLLLFGKAFDLKKESQLRFIGSNPPDPVLNIEASHKTRDGEIVMVRITGRGSAPIVTFFVDDSEVDASIAVETLFGSKKTGESDDDPALQAKSFVSALSAGALATAARRELGAAAPILMIDPDDTAGEGRVRAGFELDEVVPSFLRPLITGVYLEGIVARESDGEAAAETNFGALLEIYFPKNLYAAGQYGPGTTWSIDFGWQY